MNDIQQQRIELAIQKSPELFACGGPYDWCVLHDTWCHTLTKGEACICSPDVVMTTKNGKFSVKADGTYEKLGVVAETIPVILDPRNPELN